MVIIDEKSLQPPPPYVSSPHSHPPPFPHRRQILTFSVLPSHILLKIVYLTFPQTPGFDEGRPERQRKTLYWLSVGLRLVNRAFYIGKRTRVWILPMNNHNPSSACMHVLRSTYLPAYDSLIRPPYSSDPFPLEFTDSPGLTPLQTIQRETQVLDLFIAVKVREDVWMDDSELHLEREESFKDLFDHSQPRSRLEDLVRIYGGREELITFPTASSSSPTSTSPTSVVFRGPGSSSGTGKGSGFASSSLGPSQGPSPLPFSSLSVTFSPRSVGLVLTSKGRKRTIVQTARARDEKLEVTAKKLVKELRAWLRG